MCNKTNLTQYVLMPQHNCLVDFCLSKPRSFLSCEEDLDSNTLITPLALPHLTIAAFPNTSNERYLLCYRSLNLTRIVTSHCNKYVAYGAFNILTVTSCMNFLHQGFQKLSYDRHTYRCDQNYIPRRFAGGQ